VNLVADEEGGGEGKVAGVVSGGRLGSDGCI